MDTLDVAVRTPEGRFAPGHSGNPAGKRPGTKNRATVLREELREGEVSALVRVIVEKALKGNAGLARFLITNLYPALGRRPLQLDLPEGGEGDILTILDAARRAMALGEITLDETVKVQRIVEAEMRIQDRIAGKARQAARTQIKTRDAGQEAEHVDASVLHSACISPSTAQTPETEALLYSTCNSALLGGDTTVSGKEIRKELEKALHRGRARPPSGRQAA
jgi:hypothetical protein